MNSSLTSGYVDASGTALTAGGGTLVLETHDSIYGPGGQDLMTDNDGPILVYRKLWENVTPFSWLTVVVFLDYYTSTGSWVSFVYQ